MVEDRLAERYLRLDAQWPANAGLGIDVATPKAAEVLGALAGQTLGEVDPNKLDGFIAPLDSAFVSA